MRHESNFRGERMREAMDAAGLSSGQVAYRLNVSDGAVRGWTTGRRRIGIDDLMRFAVVVGYPVGYFVDPDFRLPSDFSLRIEVAKLTEQVVRLNEQIGHEPGSTVTSDEEALSYLKSSHNLSEEAVEAIRAIFREADQPSA